VPLQSTREVSGDDLNFFAKSDPTVCLDSLGPAIVSYILIVLFKDGESVCSIKRMGLAHLRKVGN